MGRREMSSRDVEEGNAKGGVGVGKKEGAETTTPKPVDHCCCRRHDGNEEAEEGDITENKKAHSQTSMPSLMFWRMRVVICCFMTAESTAGCSCPLSMEFMRAWPEVTRRVLLPTDARCS